MTTQHPAVEPVPAGYTAPTPAPDKTGNGLGVAALVLGIIGFVLAFIPLIGAVGGFVGFIGLVLGVIGLCLKGKKKGTAIAGTILSGLALIISISMGLVYAAAFVSAVDKSVSNEPGVIAEDGKPVAEDAGTRANPLALGTTVTVDDFEFTPTSATLNATKQVLAANSFNAEPDSGKQYALLNVHVKYVGEDSGRPGLNQFTFVTANGRSFDGAFVTMDGQLSDVDELFKGAEADGTVIIEIPTEGADQGLWGVSAFIGDPVFFEAE